MTGDPFSTTDRRPNRWRVAPPDSGLPADAPSPVFPVPADRLRQAWERLAADEPRMRPLGRDGDWLRYVVRTAVFRFPDDVAVRFLPIEGGSTLALGAAARYGYSDLGLNRRRVTRWLARLAAELRR
ncbi:MAG: DUF1499 domain-containing protein [Dongiaceae bacterium]